MNRFGEILRIAIVSPEIVILLLVSMAVLYFPTPIEFIGEKFSSTEKLREYIHFIPVGVFTFSVYLSFKYILLLRMQTVNCMIGGCTGHQSTGL
jgi:hypothetical protein